MFIGWQRKLYKSIYMKSLLGAATNLPSGGSTDAIIASLASNSSGCLIQYMYFIAIINSHSLI